MRGLSNNLRVAQYFEVAAGEICLISSPMQGRDAKSQKGRLQMLEGIRSTVSRLAPIDIRANIRRGGSLALPLAIAVVLLGGIAPAVSLAAVSNPIKPMLDKPCDDIAHNPYAFFGAKVLPPHAVNAVFGSTQKEVDARFAATIEANFNQASAEHTIEHLSDRELTDLASMYQSKAGTGNSRLLSILAARLSDQALLRVASAFGKDAVRQAVLLNAAPAVKASVLAKFEAVTPMQMPLPPPGPPSTNWTNTLREIYLDYRTSPALNLSTAESLSATSLYTAGAVYGAWQAGWAIGTGLNSLIETYDPSLGDAIGGTVAGMLNAGQQAAYQLGQGHFQSAFDSLFDYPITNSSNPSGPNGLTDPMVQYYQEYGPPAGDSGYWGGGGGGGCDGGDPTQPDSPDDN